MRYLCALFLAASICSSGLVNTVAAADNTLVFAALPTETPEIILTEIRPLLDYLENRLALTFHIEYVASHKELLHMFRNNEVDLAFLGPLPYITLKNDYPLAEPLVLLLEEDGQASYTCSLLVTIDGIANMSELTGLPLALTSPLSTCGYLATESILNQHGLSLEQTGFDYLLRHDLVALAVARGEFAAGGIKTSIGKKYFHLGLDILAESRPVPGRPLVINSATVKPQLIAALRQTLANTTADSQHGPLLRHGAVAASDEDFEPLRGMLLGGKRDRLP